MPPPKSPCLWAWRILRKSSLDFALLTGVTRVSKESIFSGLNNLDVCGVIADKYAASIGFTQDETAWLMRDSGAGARLPELKQWYDSYQFGQAEIYNEAEDVPHFRKWGCNISKQAMSISPASLKRQLEGFACGKT